MSCAMDKDTLALAAALSSWCNRDQYKAYNVLQDAIQQATLPATISWLAALAERYGFQQAPSINDLT